MAGQAEIMKSDTTSRRMIVISCIGGMAIKNQYRVGVGVNVVMVVKTLGRLCDISLLDGVIRFDS